MDWDINQGKTVHEVLAHSYMSFFILLTIGLFLDIVFPLDLSTGKLWAYSGSCLIIGPAIIFWAQSTSYRFAKNRLAGIPITKESFMRGPYRFVRNPTHIGIVILILGYSIATSSAILFAMSLLAVLISNRKFRTHEKILEVKYGSPYIEYQKSVPSIM